MIWSMRDSVCLVVGALAGAALWALCKAGSCREAYRRGYIKGWTDGHRSRSNRVT